MMLIIQDKLECVWIVCLKFEIDASSVKKRRRKKEFYKYAKNALVENSFCALSKQQRWHMYNSTVLWLKIISFNFIQINFSSLFLSHELHSSLVALCCMYIFGQVIGV